MLANGTGLGDLAGITVLAETSYLRDAVRRYRPDVVVLDVCHVSVIPEVDFPALVFTAARDEGSLRLAVRAGARGYVIKGADDAEIIRALRLVASGGAIFGHPVAPRLLAVVAHGRPFPLTRRQHELLDLLAAGLPNRLIARELCLSVKTVANQLSTVFHTLGVTSRAQAIVLARQRGLGRTLPA